MATMFSPTWQRFFYPESFPPLKPPAPPPPPVSAAPRPAPPEPPRRGQELLWLTWQMPAALRDAVLFNLRQTLDWRAQYCKPLTAPKTPHDYRRFGLLGEELSPEDEHTVCKKLCAELREMIRVVEATQPRLERNRLLAMHSARLGQLSRELEERGLDTLEKIRRWLEALWA